MVGLLNEDSGEYHLFLTNIDREAYSASDIAQLYRARWEIELLFKELKSRFGLEEIETTDAYINEALIIMATISLLMSRVIVDELRKLDAKQCERGDDTDASSAQVVHRRRSLAVERHVHLIQLYVILDLGYDLPDLDELLLWASRDPIHTGRGYVSRWSLASSRNELA